MLGESADLKRVKKSEESVDVASVLLARQKRRDTIEHIFTLKRLTAAETRLVVPIHLLVGIDDLGSPRRLLYQLGAGGRLGIIELLSKQLLDEPLVDVGLRELAGTFKNATRMGR